MNEIYTWSCRQTFSYTVEGFLNSPASQLLIYNMNNGYFLALGTLNIIGEFMLDQSYVVTYIVT